MTSGVYFLRHQNIVKVGRSNVIQRRISGLVKTLKGAQAIGVIHCEKKRTRQLELAWLLRLKPWRAYGREWFFAAPRLLKAILAAAEPAPALTDGQILARMRWHGTTKSKRRAHAHKMVKARQQKAKVNGKAKA